MKKLILLFGICLVLFTCGKDSDEPAPNVNTAQKFDLAVSASQGGSVDTSGGPYDSNSSVTITANPDDGYYFVVWSGSVSSTEISIDFVMDSDKTISAVFEELIDDDEGGNANSQYTFNEIDLDKPPFGGTIFITGDIITSTDPSLFSEIEYKGTGLREMFDRRNGGAWINIEPYLFDTSFSDGLKTEIQINPEFTLEEATAEANKYAFLIGQLPTGLRQDVQTMWIHKGYEGYGGGNYNLLVHTGMTETYENYLAFGKGDPSIVEETLIHEATHTSIDAYHYPDRETDGAAWIDEVSCNPN